MMELADTTDESMKMIKGKVAELTRPARAINEKMRSQKRKPQRRKRKNQPRPAKNNNWLTPFCWSQIVIVAKQVGWKMSASAIADGLKKHDPITFARINRTTINGWIDRSGDRPRWTEKTLQRAENGNSPGHNKGSRRGILSQHPEIVDAIKMRLEFLREKNAPVSLITARAMIVATILEMKPNIFGHKFKDGSSFRVSESFARNFLHEILSWSLRKATQAAQKLPKDWQKQCIRSFFRKAYVIKEHDIPIYLFINFDQTQVIYVPGNRMTWSQTGAKQVGMVGMDEKRAFTLVVGVSADGSLLLFQAVFVGKTKASVPSATDLPNVWSVHRSKEFREWMRINHPTIILDYVPGGCTGVHQPCDVGIQRPLKLSIKKTYHEDVVEDLLSEANKGTSAPKLKEGLKDLRDRTPRWMWNAYKALNDEKLVKKVS
jgi:hypothetical protein